MVRVIYVILSFKFILFFEFCSKCDQTKEFKLLWSSKDIYDKNDFSTSVTFNYFDEFPIYNNSVVISGNKNNNVVYYNIDIATGKTKWEFTHQRYGGNVSINNPCIKDSFWYFGDTDKLYRVNLNNGQKTFITIQKNNCVLSNDVHFLGEYFFILAANAKYIYYGQNFDLNSYNFLPNVAYQTTYTFPNNQDYYYSIMLDKLFRNYNDEVCVFLGFQEVDTKDKNNMVYKTSLYNVTKQKFVYDGKEISINNANSNLPILERILFITPNEEIGSRIGKLELALFIEISLPSYTNFCFVTLYKLVL